METGKFAVYFYTMIYSETFFPALINKTNMYSQIAILLLMIVIQVLETVWYYSFMAAGEIPIHSNEIRNITIAMNFRKIESNL